MKILLIDTEKEDESKNYSDVAKLLDNTKIAFTSINILKFSENSEYFFIHFDFIFFDLKNENHLDIELVEKYKKYKNILFVPFIFLFETIDLTILSKMCRLDSFNFLIQPITSEDLLTKINHYIIDNNEKYFENYKMIIKGNIVNKLEHQWKQPLNYISTNLLNLEIKSELGKLEHNSIQKINKNIESAIMKISNNISHVNKCFQSSKNKTNFTLNSAIEKNLDIVLYRIIQNNIKLEKLPKNLNKEINNYENDFALTIMLFLYILVEWSIKEKEQNEEVIVTISCEKDEKEIFLCFSLNKLIPFNSILKNFNVEIFLIKKLLMKTKLIYSFSCQNEKSLFKIEMDEDKRL